MTLPEMNGIMRQLSSFNIKSGSAEWFGLDTIAYKEEYQ